MKEFKNKVTEKNFCALCDRFQGEMENRVPSFFEAAVTVFEKN